MAGKVKVVIAFDADNNRIGKTVEVDPDEARILVAEGRARYLDERPRPVPSPTPNPGAGPMPGS
ncbi:hypothetical protein ACFQE5_01835 [Pseudonocardia hispaniensis]|uniref:Lsr2 protein n=1 Tax=Pseudonocardia hispaniensis TaxID=904933 RepID=A0ABW1IWW4_9PSEU